MVKTYNINNQCNIKLSTNFTVKEFACKDGSDSVLIDAALVEVLQKIRDHFGKPVVINSAYRTPEHNRKVGGSSGSYHVKGMAADIQISGVSAVEIAYFAQTITNGVGVYYYGNTNFVHVDTRQNRTFWLCAQSGRYEYYRTDLMPIIKRGTNVGKTSAVKFVQKKLGLHIDGQFGKNTEDKVKEFQKAHGLTADGIVGMNTWKAMFIR